MLAEVIETAIRVAAERLSVEAAVLKAVVQVESGGKVFDLVGDRQMPLIRWEGHYFYRLIALELRPKAVRLGLASPRAGEVKNPQGQAARYNLLERAKQLDNDAAIASCSWGVGQVMGAHWQWLGFDSAQHLADVAVSGIEGQLDLMIRFMGKANCIDELQRRDFYGFARIYNGPGQVDVYGKLINSAFIRFSGEKPANRQSYLSIGSKGSEVSELQEKLRKLGYYLHVDGDFGTATRQALRAFQTDQGLQVDGVLTPQTWVVIEGLQGVGRAS